MRLADIEIGSEYAVSVNERQLDMPDGDDVALWRRHITHGHLDRAISGYKARVLAIEPKERGHRLIRVELAGTNLRLEERIEDHLDGTRTVWRGYREHEDGSPVEDEFVVEALISPAQVLMTWDEAEISSAVRRARFQTPREFSGITW
jgi:hypothetical protein